MSDKENLADEYDESNITVIQDVSETLKNLIENNIKEIPTNSVVFDSPAEMQKDAKSGLSLFLYQILENPHMKNQKMIQNGGNNSDSLNKLRYPPVTVDLMYLVTPYAQTKQAEQVILSKIIRVFHDNAIVHGSQLKQNLIDTDNTELRIVFNTIPLEQLNSLWSTFQNTAYKPSLSYVVTPVNIPSSRTVETGRVVSKKTFYSTTKSMR